MLLLLLLFLFFVCFCFCFVCLLLLLFCIFLHCIFITWNVDTHFAKILLQSAFRSFFRKLYSSFLPLIFIIILYQTLFQYHTTKQTGIKKHNMILRTWSKGHKGLRKITPFTKVSTNIIVTASGELRIISNRCSTYKPLWQMNL